MNLAILGGKKWQFAIIGQNLVKNLSYQASEITKTCLHPPYFQKPFLT
jgi:hypothetical protein